jgi:hypothetical protein
MYKDFLKSFKAIVIAKAAYDLDKTLLINNILL